MLIEYLQAIPYILISLVAVHYMFKTYVTHKGTKMAKDSVTNIITDEAINNHINNLLKTHLERISNDDEINKSIAELLKKQFIKLLDDDEIDVAFVNALKKYLIKTSCNAEVVKIVNMALEKQVDSIVEEEWFKVTIHDKLKVILSGACDDEDNKNKLAGFFESILDELCKSEKTKLSITDGLTKVANDPEIQNQLGIAMRKAAKNAIFGAPKPKKEKD